MVRSGIRLPTQRKLFSLIATLIVAVIGALYSQWTAQPKDAGLMGVATVIDGDTIDIHGQRIRFHGIDAPESRQTCEENGKPWRCGQRAALALSDYLGQKSVRCEKKDVDRYKRIVAICYVGTTDVNAWLVNEGWAMAYRQYSKEYVVNEQAARRQKIGIWQGDVEAPWDWRRKSKKQS